MVAGVAHDIANPTGLIALSNEQAIEALKKKSELMDACFGDVDDAETSKVYQAFKGYQADIESALTRACLGVSQITSINGAIRNQSRSDQTVTRESLREIAKECIVVAGSRLKGINVELDIPVELEFELIRSQFGQVLMNLIANAGDAVSEKNDEGSGERIIIRARHAYLMEDLNYD